MEKLIETSISTVHQQKKKKKICTNTCRRAMNRRLSRINQHDVINVGQRFYFPVHRVNSHIKKRACVVHASKECFKAIKRLRLNIIMLEFEFFLRTI